MRGVFVVIALWGLLLTGYGAGDMGAKLCADRHLAHSADEIDWPRGRASLPEGSEVAVLEDDPDEANMRLRFPDGYSVPPHWPPNFERIT